MNVTEAIEEATKKKGFEGTGALYIGDYWNMAGARNTTSQMGLILQWYLFNLTMEHTKSWTL
jgi:hypothetical protein